MGFFHDHNEMAPHDFDDVLLRLCDTCMTKWENRVGNQIELCEPCARRLRKMRDELIQRAKDLQEEITELEARQ